MTMTLDYTHALASGIGATHGLTDAEIDTLVAKFPRHHENVEKLRASGESAFFDLPYQDPRPVTELLKAHKGKWEALVVVGIGGAAITPKSMLGALGHAYRNLLPAKARKQGPLIFFLDNCDPHLCRELLDVIEVKKTLFLLISKSGFTPECNALYLWLRNLLKKAGKTFTAKNLLVATAPGSPVAELAANDKSEIIGIPPNLGDRFSLLAPHNLFIAGLAGLDIKALLAGSAEIDQHCRHDRAMENPAYLHSLIHYLLTRKRRKTVHALMPFSDRLHHVVEWYCHLLSVSLGKMHNRKGKAVHVGPDPAYCVGPAGNYGQMQLYQEGPFDKMITFITARDHGQAVTVPKDVDKLEDFAHLGDVDLARLMDYGYQTAAEVITAAGRPNMTFILDDISEASVAGLYYLLELSTVMSAELYGIDAFDQPGVEVNKTGVLGQLGVEGYADRAATHEAFRQSERQTC